MTSGRRRPRVSDGALERRAVFFVLAALSVAPSGAQGQSRAVGPATTSPVRIAVLYRDMETGETGTGKRYLSGVQQALDDFRAGHDSPEIELQPQPYVEEEGGFRALTALLEDPALHVVLGPTDSGVFAKADESHDLLVQGGVAVISPLVTAEVPNRRDGWLFRTNLTGSRRAHAIYDSLKQEGVRTMAVLYSDTTFGRHAEEAFRRQLDARQQESYLSMRFRTLDDVRDALNRVLEERPGALGIFALRHEIRDVSAELRRMNVSWNPYDPLIFSLVDARVLAIAGLRFVSTSGTGRVDEVEGLAYDTATYVLRTAAAVKTSPSSAAWRQEFRDRFAALLEGPPQELPTKTGMRFSSRENRAEPGVYYVQDAAVHPVQLGEPPSWYERPRQWFAALERRFGYLPWINLVLLIGVVTWRSVNDVRRWYTGRLRSFLRVPFLVFIGFNVGTASVLYLFLTETAHLSWASTLGALTVALAHTAILKSTVFETATGRSIGLAQVYESWVKHINSRLMLAKYESENAKIKFIAYTNSLPNLRSTLRDVYRFAKTPEQSQELMTTLDEAIAAEENILDKRVYCARQILMTMRWPQLVERRLVPPDLAEHQVIDPTFLRRLSADYVLDNPAISLDDVKTRVATELGRLRNEKPASAYEEAERDLDDSLQYAKTERGRLEAYLNWLFMQRTFRIQSLKETGYLPPDVDEKLAALVEDRRRRRRRRRRLGKAKSG